MTLYNLQEPSSFHYLYKPFPLHFFYIFPKYTDLYSNPIKKEEIFENPIVQRLQTVQINVQETWTNYLIHVANNIDKWKLYHLAYNQSRKEKLFTSCPTVSKDNKLFDEILNRNERNYLIHVANNKGPRGCANESVSFRKILP